MSSFILECKQCGGEVPCEEGKQVAICSYCGSLNTIAKSIEAQGGLVNRANYLRRNNEFDKALAVYEELLKQDNTDYEAHWGLVLCRYGIEYVEDPATHQKIPTCHRTLSESIFTDLSYKTALEYAPLDVREVYEREAAQIDGIQKNIIALSQREEKYDVFICYKEADEAGDRTPDSVIAQELEFELSKHGYKVFFARKTLEGKLGSAYEPVIFAALQSAKVMVAIGTKPEYFTAVWVKNEWSRYRELIRKGAQKTLIPAYRDMSPYDLPQEFSSLQALDMSKLGFMQDLCDGIDRLTRKRSIDSAEKSETVPGLDALLKRALLFIEEGDYAKGSAYIERVLDLDPEEPRAYIAKLVMELGLRKESQLTLCNLPFDNYTNFKKAVRFADSGLKAMYEGYNQEIIRRIEEAERIEAEKEAQRREEDRKRVVAEQERIRQEYEKKQELKKLQRKKMRKFHLIFWPGVALFITIVIIVNAVNISGKYDEAIRLKDEGNFQQAMEIFGGLGNYKDAATQYQTAAKIVEEEHNQSLYKEAVAQMNKGNLDAAIENLSQILEYKDSSTLLNEACYQKAIILYDKGSYSDALYVFIDNNLESYKDAPQYLYDIAHGTYKEKNFGVALLAWRAVGDAVETDKKTIEKFANLSKQMIRSLRTGYKSIYGITFNGSVLAATASNEYGQCNVTTWKDIYGIAPGGDFTLGVKTNGTVVAVGKDDYGQCSVSKWKGVTTAVRAPKHSVGLKSDGTVLATGYNKKKQCNVKKWNKISDIAANADCTLGLKNDGTVVATGDNKNGQMNVNKWNNIIQIAAGSSHTVGVKSNGSVVAVGSNTSGQCDVKDWKDISYVIAGENYTLGLRNNGSAVLSGEHEGRPDINKMCNIRQIRVSATHIVGLKSDGTVVAIGSNQSHQCDVSDWKHILAIAVGDSFTVGLKSDGTVIVAGDISGFEGDISKWHLW